MPKLKLSTIRSGIQRPLLFLCTFSLFILLATLFKFNTFKSFLVPNINNSIFNNIHPLDNDIDQTLTLTQPQVKHTLETIIQKLQTQIQTLTENPSQEPINPSEYHTFLADILGLIESVHESLPNDKDQPFLLSKQQQKNPEDHFTIEELRKYVEPKPNRLAKPNFMGSNATFTTIGHACLFAMKNDIEDYMSYDIGDVCDDDWRVAQRLMVGGCDPMPRRRCFARAPKLYASPSALPEAMWDLPDDRNVRWSNYKCKSFKCLANNTVSFRKGFFKCVDCFDLVGHEAPRWVVLTNLSSDFLLTDVLRIKPGGIRIGLDFSVGTGTFAARMRELNVTIVTATINLGAPFSEMIALRGLVPLYLTINQRLPFFDNTLDMIHTTRFLDGWIDLVLLEFVLYDWDRVLRPGGLLWIDSFFCLKEDLEDYLESFKMLRYKKHKWVVVPKLDKDDREVFFSAVLEKPPRPFR